MEKIKFRYLSEKDLLDLDIKWDEIFDCVKTALREHGQKTVENPPKPGVHSRNDSFIHAMPAYLSQMDAIGIKWVSGYPSNRAKNLPVINGLQIINSPETGLPLAVMNATWTTTVRTAAVSAVTAKYCAKKQSKVLAIIGAGVQGKINAISLKQIMPNLEICKVYDKFADASIAFKEEVSKKANYNTIEIVDNAKDAVKDADIVLTATQDLKEPIVKLEWLKDGVLGLPLESSKAWCDEALFGVDKFVCDDIKQAQYYKTQGDFSGGIPSLYAETGEIVGECKEGRINDMEKIIVVNMGMACEDVVFGTYIYNKAEKMKIGTILEL